MDNGPGWLPDPEDGDRERYWNGSDWTDRVRPAGKGRSLHLPEHVPELQRALAAATADIDAVEDRLSTMFDRADSPAPPSTTPIPSAGQDTDDPDGNGAFAELSRPGSRGGRGAGEVQARPLPPALVTSAGPPCGLTAMTPWPLRSASRRSGREARADGAGLKPGLGPGR